MGQASKLPFKECVARLVTALGSARLVLPVWSAWLVLSQLLGVRGSSCHSSWECEARLVSSWSAWLVLSQLLGVRGLPCQLLECVARLVSLECVARLVSLECVARLVSLLASSWSARLALLDGVRGKPRNN